TRGPVPRGASTRGAGNCSGGPARRTTVAIGAPALRRLFPWSNGWDVRVAPVVQFFGGQLEGGRLLGEQVLVREGRHLPCVDLPAVQEGGGGGDEQHRGQHQQPVLRITGLVDQHPDRVRRGEPAQ